MIVQYTTHFLARIDPGRVNFYSTQSHEISWQFADYLNTWDISYSENKIGRSQVAESSNPASLA